MSKLEGQFTVHDLLDVLVEEFQLEKDGLSPSSTLMEDCGLDSMGMYELLLILEEYGFEIDEESLFSWYRVMDVYDTCSRQRVA